MRTVEKATETYVAEGKNWKKELNHFLRVYRSTPHATTGKSPYELLFGRPMRIKLPEMSVRRDSDFSIYHRDTAVEKKMKQHADVCTHAKPCKIQTGDTVLVRQDKHNKLSSPLQPNQYVVTRRKGSMITTKRCSMDPWSPEIHLFTNYCLHQQENVIRKGWKRRSH